MRDDEILIRVATAGICHTAIASATKRTACLSQSCCVMRAPTRPNGGRAALCLPIRAMKVVELLIASGQRCRVSVCLGVEEFQRLKFFCVRESVSDTASEFASRFQWRVKLLGSIWVEGWYSGKPDFHSFDRTTRSANELVEGRAVSP